MSDLFKPIAVAGMVVLLTGVACRVAGARINTTRSMPIGLYWTSTTAMEKGAYVLFCPPPVGVFVEARRRGYIGAGFCPGDFGYLMKRVVAAQGDAVAVGDEGVRVNGRLLPLSAPLKADHAGRPLPRYRATGVPLGQAQVLLMSDASATSFDGRYFGPVARAQLVTTLIPVMTW